MRAAAVTLSLQLVRNGAVRAAKNTLEAAYFAIARLPRCRSLCRYRSSAGGTRRLKRRSPPPASS